MLKCFFVFALAATVEANVDRTGRHRGGYHSRVAEGVRCITVQVGSAAKQDIHFRWEKDFTLKGLRAHVAARTSWPKDESVDNKVGPNGVLDSITVSGAALDIVYQAKYTDDATDVNLAYSLPGGLQLMSDMQLGNGEREVTSVSAFHTAGAFNIQPTWLLASKRLRLKLGRGMRRFACPVSLTTEFDPSNGLADASYEIGMRQELGGRALRAKLLLPPKREDQKLWAELRDNTVDEGGAWIAKATMPVEAMRLVEFTLRRAWQF